MLDEADVVVSRSPKVSSLVASANGVDERERRVLTKGSDAEGDEEGIGVASDLGGRCRSIGGDGGREASLGGRGGGATGESWRKAGQSIDSNLESVDATARDLEELEVAQYRIVAENDQCR